MRVLIVESTIELAELWQKHMRRQGFEVALAPTADTAVAMLSASAYDVVVIDLILEEGSGMAVADYAQYRQPDAALIFVTDTTFFSDGSIFSLIPNARAFLQSGTPPDDLAALVEHCSSVA